jgi:endonuclease/exonuclease/phosphatase (EEP) superfamily protein YafD
MFEYRFRRLRSLIGWLSLTGGVTVCLLGLAAFMAPGFWAADNMSFFLRQFLAAGLAGLLGGLLGLTVPHRRPGLYKTSLVLHALLFAMLAGSTVWRTVEHTRPLTAARPGETSLRVVATNLETLFLENRILTDFLTKSEADVMVFEETGWWLQKRHWKALGLPIGAAGKPPFPDHFFVGSLGDISVYSRFPILESKSIVVEDRPGQPRQDIREILVLKLDIDGRTVNLVAVHPSSPRTEVQWIRRQTYLERLEAVLRDLQAQSATETIVIGDWNLSPWSAYFSNLFGKLNLGTAFPDGFPQTTRFFFDYRLHWILGAVVDHVAITPGLRFSDVKLGPDIGSDHLPLMADIVLPGVAKMKSAN